MSAHLNIAHLYVLDEAKTGNLIFQRLPRHMRRRVMGHNVKRMPKSLRAAYSQQVLIFPFFPRLKIFLNVIYCFSYLYLAFEKCGGTHHKTQDSKQET